MKQTENVSIGGYSFSIEEDAYTKLNEYFEVLNAKYSNDCYASEILSDIEERIAELFIEKGGKECVVTYPMVDMVIGIIGIPSDIDEDTQKMDKGHSPDDSEDSSAMEKNLRKKIFRNPDNRIIAGVCSGLAAYFRADESIVRFLTAAAFILSTIMLNTLSNYNFPESLILSSLFFGTIYILLWIIVPQAKTIEQKCRMNDSPINLEDFEKKFENKSKTLKREIGNTAVIHNIKRAFCIPLGILLICGGITGMIFSFTYDLMPEICYKVAGIGDPLYNPGDSEITINNLITEKNFWILVGVTTAILSILLFYNGIIALFDLKSPKWKPGMILFIIFLIFLIVTTIYTIRNILTTGIGI